MFAGVRSMTAALLRDRDYTVIFARSASRAERAIPGLERHWQVARQFVVALARKLDEVDPDGIAVYVACRPVKRFECPTSARAAELMRDACLAYEPGLPEALSDALEQFFARQATGKPRAEIIVFLDAEPCDRRAVVRALVDATHRAEDARELAVMFVQVGEDALTQGFLKALDEDLAAAGARFDIAKTVLVDDLAPDALEAFLLDAICQ